MLVLLGTKPVNFPNHKLVSKMKNFLKKIKPSWLAASLIGVLLLILLFEYVIISANKNNLAKKNAKIIESLLLENFEQSERILIFVGRKIAAEAPTLNLNAINKIFNQVSAIHGANSLFSWSMFDFVDRNGYQTLNTAHGIRPIPLNVSDRHYNTGRGADHWTLLFSPPLVGNSSDSYVIPIGVQIEVKNDSRAGAVVLGIIIRKLINLIESRVDRNIEFALIDKKSKKFTIGSQDAEKNFKDCSYEEIFLRNPNLFAAVEMSERYPYQILLKYNKKQFWLEVIGKSLIAWLQVIGLAIAVLILQKAFLEKKSRSR